MSLKNRYPVAFKELKTVFRERTLAVNILFQLALLLAFSLTLSGASAFMGASPSNSDTKIAVIEGPYSQNLTQILRDDGSNVREIERDQVRPQNPLFDIIIEPRNSSGRLETYIFIQDSLQSRLALQEISSELSMLEQKLREPVNIENRGIPVSKIRETSETDLEKAELTSTRWEFKYLTLVPLLLFMPILLSGNLLIDSISSEFSEKTDELLKISPENSSSIMKQLIGAYTIIGIPQIALWTLMFQIRGIKLQNPVLILLTASKFLILYLSISSILALKYRDRKKANITYALIMALIITSIGLSLNPLTIISKQAIQTSATTLILQTALYITLTLTLSIILIKKTGKMAEKVF